MALCNPLRILRMDANSDLNGREQRFASEANGEVHATVGTMSLAGEDAEMLSFLGVLSDNRDC